MENVQRNDQRTAERMPDASFQLMDFTFRLIDSISPHVEKRAFTFGLQPGMTVVDYGCGPGRYTVHFSRIVGASGKVYAVDIHELAIEAVTSKRERYGLENIQPVLAHGYRTGLPGGIADRIIALDMFFGIRQPAEFLAELKRLIKPEGLLIIDDGHQSRLATLRKILDSGLWKIELETRDHLECRPV